MPISNCKRCGRIFNKMGRDICPECIREEDALLGEIRQLLRKRPHSTIHDVAEGVSVEYDDIVDLIRAGRLILRDNPNMSYPCERCGGPTSSGRYCPACSRQLANGFQQASAALKDKEKQKPGKGFYSKS